MNFLQKIMGKVSDAIPNEITKTNSLTRWIPYVGVATRAVSAVDNFGETYSNNDGGVQGFMDAAQHGATGAMGTSADPNMYSPKNQPGLSNDWGDDWSLNLGKMGNIYGGYKSGNYGSAAGGVVDLFTKPGNESGENVFGQKGDYFGRNINFSSLGSGVDSYRSGNAGNGSGGFDFSQIGNMDPKQMQSLIPILQSFMNTKQSQNSPTQQPFPEVPGNEPRLDMGGSPYMEIPGAVYTADISGQLTKGPAPWMGIYG